jgi:hypothetical protein
MNYLLAGEFIEFGSSGGVFDKCRIIEAIQQAGSETIIPISLADLAVRRLAPSVMLVTYRATSQDVDFASAKVNMEIDGGSMANGVSSLNGSTLTRRPM